MHQKTEVHIFDKKLNVIEDDVGNQFWYDEEGNLIAVVDIIAEEVPEDEQPFIETIRQTEISEGTTRYLEFGFEDWPNNKNDAMAHMTVTEWQNGEGIHVAINGGVHGDQNFDLTYTRLQAMNKLANKLWTQ